MIVGNAQPPRRRRGRTRRLSAGVAAAAIVGVLVAACSSSPTPALGSPASSATESGAAGSGATGSATGASASAAASAPAGSSTAASASDAQQGGTAYWAEQPGNDPNWIWPFDTASQLSDANTIEFQYLMYRPLYWLGNGDQPTVNPSLSIADPPKFTDGGTEVTIQLKPYRWSNGESVDAADVEFWMNMMKAEKTNWAEYVTGDIPDNVVSVTSTGPDTVVFHLDRAYSSLWFTENELSQITPMPMAWDKTSQGDAPGSGGCHTSQAKCPAVYKFLEAQGKDLTSYATSPLWKVVDGPWRLSKYSTDGQVEFVPNSSYSGPVKPRLDTFVELPFTTETAEYNVLRAGGVSVGYVPSVDLPPLPAGGNLPTDTQLDARYTLAKQDTWGFYFAVLNFNNPTVGAIFRQTYIRKALQDLIDQPLVATKGASGYAYPSAGPVPAEPVTTFLSPRAKSGPFHYDPAAAVALLKQHGWKVVPDGQTTCSRPGTGPTDCGTGVAAGAPLTFDAGYTSGKHLLTTLWQEFKSAATQAGIVINLRPGPFDTVASTASPCKPSARTCTWQIEQWGGGPYSGMPSGGQLFASNAAANAGSYANAQMDKLIAKVHTSSSLQTFYQYEDYVIDQLPVLFMPTPYTVNAIASNLHGVTPLSPLLTINPENWYFTK